MLSIQKSNYQSMCIGPPIYLFLKCWVWIVIRCDFTNCLAFMDLIYHQNQICLLESLSNPEICVYGCGL